MGEMDKGAVSAAPSPTGHSRYGASGAHRWTACPGSIRAEAGQPNNTSAFAEEGTALHAVAALCLENEQDAIEYAGKIITTDAGTEVEIDEDHCDAVQVYLDAIRKDKAERGGKLLVERRFHLEHLHSEFFGTCDCVRLGTDNVLAVYDAKFGRGKIVEVGTPADPNLQAAFYALGAGASLPSTVRIKHVELVIVQPRAWHKDGPVRRTRVTPHALHRIARKLVAAARACEEPDAPLVAGDHCGFCRAAGVCPALRAKALKTAQLDFDDETGVVPKLIGDQTVNPLDLSNEQLAHVLDAADIVESWLKAVRFHAHLIAHAGREIPGWKLKDRIARRKWKDDAATQQALLFEFGLDESSIFKHTLLSPAQVEKLLPKPERKQLANLYSAESSGTTLVRASNGAAPAIPRASADFDDGLSLSADAEW